MTEKVRWGVIGAGGIADRRTIPGLMLAENAEHIAVMEVNMELPEKCRKKGTVKEPTIMKQTFYQILKLMQFILLPPFFFI